MILEKNYLLYCLRYPIQSWRNKCYKTYFKRKARQHSLFDQTLDEVADYLQRSTEEVSAMFRSEPNPNLYAIFQDDKQSNLTEKDVKDFYRDHEVYLYELPLWNAEVGRPQMLRAVVDPYLKRFQCKSVLDVGGGAGDLCIELSQHHYDVLYFDISESLSNFAQWRFSRRELSIPQHKDFASLADNALDAVITFDVMEHVKNMSQFVKDMVRVIRPGGLFIFSGAFSGGGLHLRENEQYADNVVLNDMLKSAGVRFYDKLAQNYIYVKK